MPDKKPKNPSEVISEFLAFLDFASSEYETSFANAGKEDSKVITFAHDFEFAANKNERNKIATKFQQSRRYRRKEKDRAQLYELVHKFYSDKQNQVLIKALNRLLNDQIAREKYLFGEREFKHRVD